MKKTLSLLLAAALLSFASCSNAPAENKETKDTAVMDSVSGAQTTTPITTAPQTTAPQTTAETTAAETEPPAPEETVIYEGEEGKLALLSMEKNDEDLWVLTLRAESPSDIQMCFSLHGVTVNGMQSSARLNRIPNAYLTTPTIEAGKDMSFQLTLSEYGNERLSILDPTAIDDPTDICLILRDYVRNRAFTAHIYPAGEDKAVKTTYHAEKDDTVLLDNEYVKITRITKQTPDDESWYEPGSILLPTVIENKTDEDIDVFLQNIKVEGVADGTPYSMELKPLGSCADPVLRSSSRYYNLGFLKSNLERLGSPDVSTIKKIECDVVLGKAKNLNYLPGAASAVEFYRTHLEIDY